MWEDISPSWSSLKREEFFSLIKMSWLNEWMNSFAVLSRRLMRAGDYALGRLEMAVNIHSLSSWRWLFVGVFLPCQLSFRVQISFLYSNRRAPRLKHTPSVLSKLFIMNRVFNNQSIEAFRRLFDPIESRPGLIESIRRISFVWLVDYVVGQLSGAPQGKKILP